MNRKVILDLGFATVPPITVDGGYKVEIVDPGSSADKSGIRAGDIIYKIDGRPIGSMSFDALGDALNASGTERSFATGSADRKGRRTVKIVPITY